MIGSENMRRTSQTSNMESVENSKRRRALEYAKGISKPNDLRMQNSAIEVDDMEDIEQYQADYSYNYNNPHLEELENNHEDYVSQIEKIKAMFN